MTHEEAIGSNAVARYMLDEYSDTEGDAFEEHYFDCPTCADDVRAAAMLFAAGREIVRNGG